MTEPNDLPPETSGDGEPTDTTTETAFPPPPTLVGRVVDYNTEDPVTGQPLNGTGVVVQDVGGQVLVAPLTVLGIHLDADAVTAR